MLKLLNGLEDFKNFSQSSSFQQISSPTEIWKSIFDDNRRTIMTFFSKKWNKLSKSEYTSMFSTIKWKGMAEAEQLQHSLSYFNCCSRNRQDLQVAFPGKPMYTAPPAFVTRSGEQTCTKKAERKKLGVSSMNSIHCGKISTITPLLMLCLH